ncbi:FIVAR domain-containing protein, partial [Blautia wexlerae]|nr:FIVAR domain-containing protein [Blautia wexlerae]
ATQAEIDDAWSELMHMIHMLSFVSGDKTALEGLIETALTLDENDYLTSAWSDFETALAEAQEVVADDDALKNDIENAYESLYDAMIALLESNRADRAELDEVIAQAEAIDLDEYLDAGQEAFNEALEQAKAIGPNATQKEVDKAANALGEALANLRKKPDRAELEDLLARMQAKNLSSYTASSAAKYTAAANGLAAALANPDATPEELAAAEDAALLAEKNLENKPHNSSKGTSSGSSGTSRKPANAYGEGGTAVVSPVVNAAQAVVEKAFVRSDTTLPFTLIRGSAYCFKMTVVNGENLTPKFTVGNGSVLKTQFIAKIGNDYYYRVYAIGTPGQSTGVYTTMPGENAQQHCIVTIG